MKHIITAIVVLNLAGCGWLGLRDRSNDYLLAEEVQATTVSSAMDSVVLGQIYPIPQIATDSVELVAFEVPRPQPVSVNTFEQLVKIQSIDGRRWVLINISPSEAWPRIRNVLNRNGVPSAKAEGSSGIIETVWVKFNSDEEHSHRFRFAIAPGVQVASTEISVVHQKATRGDEDNVKWPAVSDSEEREQDMLTLVANEMAASADYASVSLLAQDIGGEAKVAVMTPEATDPYILVKLGFDRAWASVSYSASRGGFITIDKNRSEGIFYVNYTEKSVGDEGFFNRWFGGSDDSERLEVNYRVLVAPVGADVEVRLVGPEDGGLVKAEALRLLKVLRGNMS